MRKMICHFPGLGKGKGKDRLIPMVGRWRQREGVTWRHRLHAPPGKATSTASRRRHGSHDGNVGGASLPSRRRTVDFLFSWGTRVTKLGGGSAAPSPLDRFFSSPKRHDRKIRRIQKPGCPPICLLSLVLFFSQDGLWCSFSGPIHHRSSI